MHRMQTGKTPLEMANMVDRPAKRSAILLIATLPLGWLGAEGEPKERLDNTGHRPPPPSVAPDASKGKELAERFDAAGDWGIWRVSKEIVREGDRGVPGLLWLVEKGDRLVRNSPMPQWLWAAYILGRMGHVQHGSALVPRLHERQAGSYHFVTALAALRVKEAVPYLVEWLQADNAWRVKSTLYGAQAGYLLDALQTITGKEFAGKRPWPPKEGGVYAESKAVIPAKVKGWWQREGAEQYPRLPLPHSATSIEEAIAIGKGILVAKLLEIGEAEMWPPNASDYSSKWQTTRVLKGSYQDITTFSFSVQSGPEDKKQRKPSVGHSYLLITYDINPKQISHILEATEENLRMVAKYMKDTPPREDKR